MKNIVALMRSELLQTSLNTDQLSRPNPAVSRSAPTEPTEAASVGAAKPPMMDPSTATIKINGGTTEVRKSFANCPADMASLSSWGMGGSACGLTTTSPSRYNR